jgi:hypothetical protein
MSVGKESNEDLRKEGNEVSKEGTQSRSVDLNLLS